jgi:hypothetical protein
MQLAVASFVTRPNHAGIRRARTGSQTLRYQDICWAAVLYSFSQGLQFARVLPSDLCSPGACRSDSLEATIKYASKGERSALDTIFRRSGCHSCGVQLASLIDS